MKVRLRTPVLDVSGLRAGTIVYLTGLVATMRDRATERLIKIVQRGLKPPIDLTATPVFHCGPVVRRTSSGWLVEALGPTTSARMEGLLAVFLAASGARLIIGKGGFSEKATGLFKQYKAVYCALPGGVSALLSKTVKRVLSVYWLDFGQPEALWLLEVERLGPMIVAIDSHGVNLYSRVRMEAYKRAGLASNPKGGDVDTFLG